MEIRALASQSDPTTLTVLSGTAPGAVLLDGDDLYTNTRDTVVRIDRTDGTANTVSDQVDVESDSCQHLAADETHLYWITLRGDVQRVARSWSVWPAGSKRSTKCSPTPDAGRARRRSSFTIPEPFGRLFLKPLSRDDLQRAAYADVAPQPDTA